jgi:hypothetical protein
MKVIEDNPSHGIGAARVARRGDPNLSLSGNPDLSKTTRNGH